MLVNSKHLSMPLVIKFWYEQNFLVKVAGTGGRTIGFRDTPPATEDNGPVYETFLTMKTGCVIKLGKDKESQTVLAEAHAQQDSRDMFVKDSGRRLALKHALRIFCEKNVLNIEDRKKRGSVHNDIINEIMEVYKTEHRTPRIRRPKK